MLGLRVLSTSPELVVSVSDRRLAAAYLEFLYRWEEWAEDSDDPAGDLAELVRRFQEATFEKAA